MQQLIEAVISCNNSQGFHVCKHWILTQTQSTRHPSCLNIIVPTKELLVSNQFCSSLKPAVQCCWMLVAGINVCLCCAENLCLYPRWVWWCGKPIDGHFFLQRLCSVIVTQTNYWIKLEALSLVDNWYGVREEMCGKLRHRFLCIYSIANLTTYHQDVIWET